MIERKTILGVVVFNRTNQYIAITLTFDSTYHSSKYTYKNIQNVTKKTNLTSHRVNMSTFLHYPKYFHSRLHNEIPLN